MNKWDQDIIKFIDRTYAYKMAKEMEKFKSNQRLGYRTAGSRAEWDTGEFIYSQMKEIGLDNVRKDAITVDGWTFEKAHLTFQDEKGNEYNCEMGGYQTQFDTKGVRTYSVVYLNKGLAKDYKNKDVKGKLVLIDMNQRDEWWINYPVYQAYLKGAAAVLAVQIGGYGEGGPSALNAQDIAGPCEAAAFSIAQKDANVLKRLCKLKGEIQVQLEAYSKVTPNTITYNIVGEIPGKSKEAMLLFTGHYDSYFSGFQDDNTAIGMLLAMAKAVKESGYKPEKTWLFCAMAAEEWGVINSKYDWSTGAFEQVFTVHPEWQGKVHLDFNIELPAYAHGKKDNMRCIYEYRSFMSKQLKQIPPHLAVYPKGVGAISPIVTWSDDFTIATSGIPSMVNDFSSGKFMKTYYHSQLDDENKYDESVYLYHHQLYLYLGYCYDQVDIVPLQFKTLFQTLKRAYRLLEDSESKQQMMELLEEISQTADKVYKKITTLNNKRMKQRLITSKRDELNLPVEEINKKLLNLFKLGQDQWVKLDWHDEVKLPQVLVGENLEHLKKARDYLKEGDITATLKMLYQIDNNRYTFFFEKEVYDYFTNYVLNQPKERLKWGYGRMISHENLYQVVALLRGTYTKKELHTVKKELKEAIHRQEQLLKKIMQQDKKQIKKMRYELEEINLLLNR